MACPCNSSSWETKTEGLLQILDQSVLNYNGLFLVVFNGLYFMIELPML